MSTHSNLSTSDTPKRFVWKGSGPQSHLKLDFGIGMMSSARNLHIQLEAGRVLDDDIQSAASNCRQQRAYDLLNQLDSLMIGAETITLADILKIDAARDRLLVACVAEAIIREADISEVTDHTDA